nr:unnamed protein product [Callosobruchus analis]
MAAERWNSETTIKFIQEFKSYECLWNHKSVSFKNKLAKDAAYQKIVQEMNIAGFGVPEAKRKMRTLRSTYYQEKKKIQNSMRSGSGSDTVYVPNLHWYKEMDSLLKDIDERRTTIENVNSSTSSEQNNPSSGEQDISMASTSEGESIPEPRGEQRQSTSSKNVSQRKGIFRAIGELKKLQEAVNRDVPEKEDRFDVFARNVAVQLRELSFERSMIAQTRIQNILSELAIENYMYTNISASNETLEDISSAGSLSNPSTPTVSSDANILSQAISMTLDDGELTQ